MHRFETENQGILENVNNPFTDLFFEKTNKTDKTLEINQKT